MKQLGLLVVAVVAGAVGARGQQPDLALSRSRTRFGIGIAGPELLHLGLSCDVSSYNQLGVSGGIGPSMNSSWPTLSAEHRLCFGKPRSLTNRRPFFFRQSATYFPLGDEGAGTLSVGVDLQSKRRNRGLTIDAGVFFMFPYEADRYYKSFPALRFQYYTYFLKAAGK